MKQKQIENRMVLPRSKRERGEAIDTVTAEGAHRAACGTTERRLQALPLTRARADEEREELSELENLGIEGLREHSLSLVRLLRPGMRLEPEEVHEMQLARLRSRLAADELEIARMDAALACIRDDPYYLTVELRYFSGVPDADIAKRLCCDRATVSRHRRRLVERLAERIYGL